MPDFGVHRAGVNRSGVAFGHGVVFTPLDPHGRGPVGVTVTGVIMAVVGVVHGLALGGQEHAAFRATTFFRAAYLGVHRAGVDRPGVAFRNCVQGFVAFGLPGWLAFAVVHLASFPVPFRRDAVYRRTENSKMCRRPAEIRCLR